MATPCSMIASGRRARATRLSGACVVWRSCAASKPRGDDSLVARSECRQPSLAELVCGIGDSRIAQQQGVRTRGNKVETCLAVVFATDAAQGDDTCRFAGIVRDLQRMVDRRLDLGVADLAEMPHIGGQIVRADENGIDT